MRYALPRTFSPLELNGSIQISRRSLCRDARRRREDMARVSSPNWKGETYRGCDAPPISASMTRDPSRNRILRPADIQTGAFGLTPAFLITMGAPCGIMLGERRWTKSLLLNG